ncbi:MAG: PQQ-binding-like beta-propeller repeat protein [Bacteroidota bacterium]
MKRKLIGTGLIVLLAVLLSMYWKMGKSLDRWEVRLPAICSFSSPRPVDLNQDGVLDIVLGAGADEFQGSDSAVIALDGKNGDILWRVKGRDQMVGSPVFLRINSDRVSDVVMSGRAGQLMAIDGQDGSVLWSYYSESDFSLFPDSVFLNFYGPQLMPDVDDDGTSDLLVAQGGDATISRYDSQRPPGQLLVVSGASGKLLAQAVMPDSAETYMTPVCTPLGNHDEITIVFGSGGETFGGHLYRASLTDLLKNDLSNAIELATGEQRGFIAPPVIVDITQDGIADIVANAVDGRMLAFDGITHESLWKVELAQAEVYGSLAVGNFCGDDTPDFFANMGRGIFPEVAQSIQIMVDGKTGEISYLDSLGFLQIGSPLATDLNGDGRDEAIMSINWYDPVLSQDHYYSLYGITTELLAFDFTEPTSHRLLGSFRGVNPAATPWMGDLDNDRQIDVIYTYITDTIHYRPFNGMKVLRKEINVPVEEISWGSYMGSSYDGVLYHPNDL